jgi:hypothetical protein
MGINAPTWQRGILTPTAFPRDARSMAGGSSRTVARLPSEDHEGRAQPRDPKGQLHIVSVRHASAGLALKARRVLNVITLLNGSTRVKAIFLDIIEILHAVIPNVEEELACNSRRSFQPNRRGFMIGEGGITRNMVKGFWSMMG